MIELDVGLSGGCPRGFIGSRTVSDTAIEIQVHHTRLVLDKTTPESHCHHQSTFQTILNPAKTSIAAMDLLGSGTPSMAASVRCRGTLWDGLSRCCGRLGDCSVTLVQRKTSAWQGRGQSVEARMSPYLHVRETSRVSYPLTSSSRWSPISTFTSHSQARWS